MKVVFFSNFLNRHQLPFCLAMDRLTEHRFTFVATTPLSEERAQMGFRDLNNQYPFVLTAYDNEEHTQLAKDLACNADVVIFGAAPEVYLTIRLKQNKLTFMATERLYKSGLTLKKLPRVCISAWLHHGRFMRKPLYMLCSSAYTAVDCARFGNYLGRTYKWGYFPEVKIHNVDELFERKHSKSKMSILWAGRMIDWKHPDDAIVMAQRLKQNGYAFQLNLIGNGVMEMQLQNMIHEKHLEECVHMLGVMSPEAVREHMENADIFLFTSDFNEGWGAVLNESMNSACAVVASHAIGAVPFLLEDGKNGYIYRNGDIDGMYNRVVRLLESSDLREQMGRKAYCTLTEKWNADVAAKRFLALAQARLNGESNNLFENGPCSKAGVLRNNWYKNG